MPCLPLRHAPAPRSTRIGPTLLSTGVLALLGPLHGQDIPYGIEMLAGFRSEYINRGFGLSQGLLETQLGSEVALSGAWMLGLGAWYGTATGAGDFEMVEAFASLQYAATRHTTLGLETRASSVEHTVFRDAVVLAPFITYRPDLDWRLEGRLEYDTGASGWYGALEVERSLVTSRDSFLTASVGLSAASGFYGRDGLNEAFARLAWNYGVNSAVAITPFVGTSVGLDDAAQTRLYAGLWFAVNF